MNKKKIVVVAGATGLIGRTLCSELSKRNYLLIVLTRDVRKAQKILSNAFQYVDWKDSDALDKVIDGAYGVINLSGASIVGKRWTQEYKKVLFESRILTTKTVVNAISKSKQRPKVLINASAVGYYRYASKETVYDEGSSPGSDFLANICVAWEKEAEKAKKYGARTVYIRSAIVLDKNEGAFPRMLTPFKFFVGGPIGSGKQWFPWIHIKDEVGIIIFALENEKVIGPINAIAPEAVTNRQLSATIGKILHRPNLIPIPTLILKLLFGESASAIKGGIKVPPQKIIQLGYKFKYPKLQQALQDLLK